MLFVLVINILFCLAYCCFDSVKIERRFMPRKSLDMRKECGRLICQRQTKTRLLLISRVAVFRPHLTCSTLLRGSCQVERGINSLRIILNTHYHLKGNHSWLFHILYVNRIRHIIHIKGKALTFVKAHVIWRVIDDDHFVVK